jgi:hypothetical protein
MKNDHIFAFGLMIVVSANEKLSFIENLHAMQASVERKTSKLESLYYHDGDGIRA